MTCAVVRQMGHRYAVGDGVKWDLHQASLLLARAAAESQAEAAKELAALPPS